MQLKDKEVVVISQEHDIEMKLQVPPQTPMAATSDFVRPSLPRNRIKKRLLNWDNPREIYATPASSIPEDRSQREGSLGPEYTSTMRSGNPSSILDSGYLVDCERSCEMDVSYDQNVDFDPLVEHTPWRIFKGRRIQPDRKVKH